MTLDDLSHDDAAAHPAEEQPGSPETQRHRATPGDSATSRAGETLFHGEPWRQAVEKSFDLEIQEFVPTCEPGGLAYYSVLSDLRGERIVSTPFSDFCDPLLGPDGWAEFTEHLRGYGLPITLRPFRNTAATNDDSFELRRELLWHGIDISQGFDPLWDGLKTKLRTKIRKADKEGITFRASSTLADLQTFHTMHVELRKAKYQLLAQPFDFFANLHDAFGDDMIVVLAEENGDAIAGMVFFAWNDVWYYKFGASRPRKYRPNGANLMEAARIGADRGLQLIDLGRSDIDQPGLVDFKRGFATEEVVLTTLHWRPEGFSNPAGDAAGATLGQLTDLLTGPDVPIEVTAQGGNLLYKFFG